MLLQVLAKARAMKSSVGYGDLKTRNPAVSQSF